MILADGLEVVVCEGWNYCLGSKESVCGHSKQCLGGNGFTEW